MIVFSEPGEPGRTPPITSSFDIQQMKHCNKCLSPKPERTHHCESSKLQRVRKSASERNYIPLNLSVGI